MMVDGGWRYSRDLRVIAGHRRIRPRNKGFTMIELIVVLILIGILSAVGYARFFDRGSFDGDSFAERARTVVRFGQQLAIAQNRPVFVQADGERIGLCFAGAAPCAAASQVPAAGGAVSSGAASACASANWYCEARPATVTLAPPAATLCFNALGQPGAYSGGGCLTPLSSYAITITAAGVSRSVAVASETGYVQ